MIGFRPLTGILFFNSSMNDLYCPRSLFVSVPLRGFCFSTSTARSALMMSWIPFPSPYGDFVFQQVEREQERHAQALSFRPLTGILFFNSYFGFIMYLFSITGFRPLTGILFFNRPSEKPCHS